MFNPIKILLFTTLSFTITELVSFLLKENFKQHKPNKKIKSIITIALAIFFSYSI